ncbi:unnamed protein product [Calicophoron daubneyi]|uniref:PDZ domain-containing protein n=1 Tax=Calicophoron daubneyi TaxID=300641 RepID=A0AAV2T551_CALDB
MYPDLSRFSYGNECHLDAANLEDWSSSDDEDADLDELLAGGVVYNDEGKLVKIGSNGSVTPGTLAAAAAAVPASAPKPPPTEPAAPPPSYSNPIPVQNCNSYSEPVPKELKSLFDGSSVAPQNKGVEAKQGEMKKVVVSRDCNNKLGVRLRRVGPSFFLSFVEQGSPAAAAGLAFGDRVDVIEGIDMAGRTGSDVMDIISQCRAREFTFHVHIRPFQTTLIIKVDTEHEISYWTKEGKAMGKARMDKVCKHGAVGRLRLVSIQNQCVLGAKDQTLHTILCSIIGRPVEARVMPRMLCDHLIRHQDKRVLRERMELGKLG